MRRFSARDLLMRYHYGLGVGHLHAHQFVASSYSSDVSEGLQSTGHELDVDLAGQTQGQFRL